MYQGILFFPGVNTPRLFYVYAWLWALLEFDVRRRYHPLNSIENIIAVYCHFPSCLFCAGGLAPRVVIVRAGVVLYRFLMSPFNETGFLLT